MSASFSPSDFVPDAVLPGDAGLQRAFGEARIALSMRGGRLAVDDLYQHSPARILSPRIDGRAHAEIVFVNTSGGVAGGDVIRYALTADGAPVRATTQAAEKIYRALDSDAVLENRLVATGGASLEWLPQSSIVFDGARLARRTEIDVEQGARVLAFDSIVLGRAAHGETMRTGAVRDDWRVRRGGKLVWADAFRLTSQGTLGGTEGDIAVQVSAAALLGGRRAVGTFLYVADGVAALLDAARDLAAGCGIMARVGVVSGLLVARFAAHAGHELMEAVSRFLAGFRALIGAAGGWPPAMWRC